MDKQITRLIQNLKRRNIAGYYVENREALHALIRELIPAKSIVGSGDSVTLEVTEVFQMLRKENYVFLDKFDKSLTKEKKRDIYIKNFSADTFISSANAVTEAGEIFNIDGNGSRVAPILYGPKQVILVIGINKITKDAATAVDRVRQTAAPLDAVRLGKNTPCVTLNRCIDCDHPNRICNDFVWITGQFEKDRIKVIILNESVGY